MTENRLHTVQFLFGVLFLKIMLAKNLAYLQDGAFKENIAMSHTTKIKTVPIKDIKALRQAVAQLQKKGLNVELRQNQAPRMYYSDQLQRHLNRKDEVCDYVLKVKDAYYDIGFIKNEQGAYDMVFDDYSHSPLHGAREGGHCGIRSVLGVSTAKMTAEQMQDKSSAIGQLLQAYTTNAAMNQATAEGYTVEQCTMDAQGNVNLVLAL